MDSGNSNSRKRTSKAVPVPVLVPVQQQPQGLFSLQAPAVGQPDHLAAPAMVGLEQLHSPAPPFVSTSLRLALDEQNQRQQADSLLFSEDVSALINQQSEEIGQFLLAEGEQLRRALSQRRQRHYQTLMAAADKSVGQRLRKKEAEIERAGRRSSELEYLLARLQAESMAWQAKAMAEEASAASLYAQLQQASAAAASAPAGKVRSGESPAEDAESAYVDPDRLEPPDRACRICRRSLASVVVIPCLHLCLCPDCNSAGAGEVCLVCGSARTESVQVFFS